MAYYGKTPLVVPAGGTGDGQVPAYTVVCGGTTNTGALQNVSGVGTSGQVLTSNGAAALPTWQAGGGGGAFTSINIQVFSSSGTYTPTAGMVYCQIEVWGGGGAGGGSDSTTQYGSAGGGGGAGGYSRGIYTAATIGASKAVTVGAGGTGVVGTTGNTGGTTSVGTIISATGGVGGSIARTNTIPNVLASGGAGGVGSLGTINETGDSGKDGFCSGAGGNHGQVSGQGGQTIWGSGGQILISANSVTNGLNTPGYSADTTSYGAGGGGSVGAVAVSTTAGGDGAGGYVLITEYI